MEKNKPNNKRQKIVLPGLQMLLDLIKQEKKEID